MKDVNIYIYTEYSGNLKSGTGKYHVILETTIRDNTGKTIPWTNVDGRNPKPIVGREENITKNRLELLSVVKALEHMTKPSRIIVYITSEYVVNAFIRDWPDKWVKNDFKSGKREIKHSDLWKKVIEQTRQHDITFIRGTVTPHSRRQAMELKNF